MTSAALSCEGPGFEIGKLDLKQLKNRNNGENNEIHFIA